MSTRTGKTTDTAQRTPRARKPAQAYGVTLPPPTETQEIWRQEVEAAARSIHERAYFRHVVLLLEERGYPLPKPQRALIPGRDYRWDFAWIGARVAVEIQGQIWHKGGHTTGGGIMRDARKVNALAEIGWYSLIFTPEMIESGEALTVTERALRRAGLKGAA